MRGRNITGMIAVCLMLCTVCKEPFTPDIPFEETNFLVVEGHINVGPGISTIKLSRTINVGAEILPYETGALVRFENENNTSYLLTEKENGVYTGDFNLPATDRYRIHIIVDEGKEYVSDFATVIRTPLIDSVTWKSRPDGVHINLSTHDVSNGTLYYQFEYEETWEIRSAFTSYFKYQSRMLVPRDIEETILMGTCWKRNASPDLILYSTAKFTADVVSDYPLVFIGLNAERISERYHILVKQHALSREAFDYLQLMKKNTGPLGGFSDPQPSELVGNIHCTTTDEPVVGYVGAYTTEQVQFYIDNSDIPGWTYDLFCVESKTAVLPDTLAKQFSSGFTLPTRGAVYENGEMVKIYRAPGICVDCRIRGGDTRKPDFWED